jgi:hypothetical protein
MLLSAVSVFVVAQSSSEIPEGLMNNPVLYGIMQSVSKMLLQTSGVNYPQQNKETRSCQLDVRKQLLVVSKMPPTSVLIFQMMVSAYTLKTQCKTTDNAYIRYVKFEYFCVMQLVSKYVRGR